MLASVYWFAHNHQTELAEGSPNEPWLIVSERTAAEIDGYIEQINDQLD